MNLYLGTKLITAVAMTRLAYNVYRGWELPADENGSDEGYLVEYMDGGKPNHAAHTGYISWSPKEQFDNAYRLVAGMSFSQALEAIKAGKSVTRLDWNGKDQFVYLLPGEQLAKATGYGFGEYIGEPTFTATLVLRNAQGNLVCGWVPSIGDLMADTWEIAQ